MHRLVGEFVGSASGMVDGIRVIVLQVRGRKRIRIGIRMILGAGLIGGALAVEIHTSWFQSKLLSAVATRLTFSVQRGSSPRVDYPNSGPYDARFGYSDLREYLDRLGTR